MKRFHVHISVQDITASTQFYAKLFGQEPSVLKDDYAKWMLDDPRVNFAISQRAAMAGASGLDHLGFQLESTSELRAMTSQLQQAGVTVSAQGETTCCYAKSDKGWVHDPQGIAWETFVTTGASTTYGSEPEPAADGAIAATACCAPVASEMPRVRVQEMVARQASCAGVKAKSNASACC